MRALTELRRLGFTVTADGGKVRVHYPAPTPPPEARPLLDELRARKAEVLAALEAEQAQPDAERAGKPTDFERANAFFRQHGWVAIRSRTLGGEVVLFLRDEGVAVPEQWRDAVAYTLEDLAALEGVTPEGLRAIHEAKRVFGGRVLRDGARVRVGERTIIEGFETFGKGAIAHEPHPAV